MLLGPDNRIFVGRRIDTPGAWQMPQGGIDGDETPRAAALRELHEEVGTNKAEIIGETEGWLIYELPGDLHLQAWGGRYRGQQQKWFAMRFLGKDSDIRLDAASRRNSTPGNGRRAKSCSATSSLSNGRFTRRRSRNSRRCSAARLLAARAVRRVVAFPTRRCRSQHD